MISVIIPTYKTKGGLVDSIDSVLSQSVHDEIEIIVVDDNNPDSEFRKNTELLMEKYSKNAIVRYIKHGQNKNGAAARNTGIRVARGEFVAFLDDDDVFLPGKLCRQLDFLNNHSELGAVYCFARNKNYPLSQKLHEGDCSRDILLLNSNMFTPSLMFRKEALEDIHGFDESFRRHQDYELLLRFFAAGYKIGCVPDVLIEIGGEGGGNVLKGKALEEMKANFLEKFYPYIIEEDKKDPGFANTVYAKHYAAVCLSHVKNRYYKRALLICYKYMPKSPVVFLRAIYHRILIHLS